MKKCLLIAFVLFSAIEGFAQKQIATPLPTKKVIHLDQKSYIQKPGGAEACDTLKINSALSWSGLVYVPTVSGLEDSGFVFGVNENSGGIARQEDANYYDVSGKDYTYITGGLAFFAFANSTNNADLMKDVIFKVYDDAGGFPNNLLGSTTLKLSDIKKDVDKGNLTEFHFSTPISIPANKIFYVSIDHSNFKWNSSVNDSLAIYTNGNDEAPDAAYQYWDIKNIGTQWIRVNEYYNDGFSFLDVNLFLFPYVTNAIGGCSTLPVSIINFKGSIINNKATLTWSTATEFNNKGFEIERSKDGKTFSDIGFVNGAGTTTQRKDYTYTDATLSDIGTATNYYRLKQIDLDGKASYSNVIPLSLKNILDWKIYPNPIKDKLTIELNLTADTKVSVQVISKDGRLLLNAYKGTLPQGNHELNFNIQNISSGSYFIRVKAGDKYYTQTIIKQ